MKKLSTLLLSICFTASFAQYNRSLPDPNKPIEHYPTSSSFQQSLDEGFESFNAFSLDLNPWQTADEDGLETYAFTDVDFPNAGQAMSFIVFNPDSTDPSLSDDPELQAHSGEQFAACFASVPAGDQGNNDWLISPQINIDSNNQLKLHAKSYTDEFGLEKINVAVSTASNNPSDFTVISGSNPINVPMAWTEYSFDLSGYEEQQIYIAIQCVSFDSFILMLDDIMLTDTNGGGSQQDFVKLDFEDVSNWSTDFGEWQNIDMDEGNTYGIVDHIYPNMNLPVGFMAFNPEGVDPPMDEDPAILPFSGDRFGASFSPVGATNNDWLISPAVMLGSSSVFSFRAKSYSDQYGLEKFNVLLSTEGVNPDDFFVISGSSPVETPVAWNKYSYDLAEYAGTEVNLAIQCVSTDAFIFMVDEILIDISADVTENISNTAQLHVYPNPVENEFEVSLNAGGTAERKIQIFDIVGKLIHEEKISAAHQKINMNASAWKEGMYFLKVIYGNGQAKSVKLVVR